MQRVTFLILGATSTYSQKKVHFKPIIKMGEQYSCTIFCNPYLILFLRKVLEDPHSLLVKDLVFGFCLAIFSIHNDITPNTIEFIINPTAPVCMNTY